MHRVRAPQQPCVGLQPSRVAPPHRAQPHHLVVLAVHQHDVRRLQRVQEATGLVVVGVR